MRRKVIISVGLHTLAAVAALLWLLWYFIRKRRLSTVWQILIFLRG